jgi:hypothetical protein
MDTPTISSLSPAHGPVGSTVIIHGTHFGDDRYRDRDDDVKTVVVSFNSRVAQGAVAAARKAAGAHDDALPTVGVVTHRTTTRVAVVVPPGATSGDVVVTVDGMSSNGSRFTVTV